MSEPLHSPRQSICYLLNGELAQHIFDTRDTDLIPRYIDGRGHFLHEGSSTSICDSSGFHDGFQVSKGRREVDTREGFVNDGLQTGPFPTTDEVMKFQWDAQDIRM